MIICVFGRPQQFTIPNLGVVHLKKHSKIYTVLYYSCICMMTNIGLIYMVSCKISHESSSLFVRALESFQELSPYDPKRVCNGFIVYCFTQEVIKFHPMSSPPFNHLLVPEETFGVSLKIRLLRRHQDSYAETVE